VTALQHQLAREIRELTAQLTAKGWDRLCCLNLAHASTRAITECHRVNWLEAIGRASELAGLFNEFAQEAPNEARLNTALQAATTLADLLDSGQYATHVERDFLPAQPQEWLFILTDKIFNSYPKFAENLTVLGFSVTRAEDMAGVTETFRADQVILIADTSWLTANAEQLIAILPTAKTSFFTSPLLAAVADTEDFRILVKTPQTGARLLLAPSLDVARLTQKLAGLVWMPRTSYRVMLIDEDPAALALHTNILETAGFEVLAIDDPVAARSFQEDFSPEAYVLNAEMSNCWGTDLAALLLRDKRPTRVPVIYLLAHSDIAHQLDARYAGGDDYLVKPVDTSLLLTTVMTRAQQFRLLKTAYDQHQHARSQHDKLKTALDAHAIVSVADADGTIVDVNQKFSELSGYSKKELIGRNHRIVKSGHHPAAFFEGMWRMLSAGRTWRGEVQNRRKDGSPYWVQSTIVPILNEHGLPEQYLSIRTDITDQKRKQEKRRHQTRMLDLLRQALQQHIASHDIAATSAVLLDGLLKLTNSVCGFLGEVLHDPNGLPYLKTHALNNVVWNGAARSLYAEKNATGMVSRNLDGLVDAVLHTGKVAAANDLDDNAYRHSLPESHPAPEDFIGIPVRHGSTLIGMVGLSLHTDGYEISSITEFLQSFTDTYGSILESARQRCFQQQAILELQQAKDDAERASRKELEFLAGRGQELRAPLNEIIGHSQILQVNETLEAETRQHLTDIANSSRQLDHLIDDLLRGLGADAVAKARQEAALLDITEAQRDSGAVQRRILVAEDNPANQAVLSMQLNVLGFAADIANDGAAAMLKWQEGGHDLILADRNMPVMNGLELTRAIRATERESGAYIPIIAITAAQHPEELSLCRQAGMDDILPKPIELDALHNMLEHWLPHASPLPSRNNASAEQTKENKLVLDTDYLTRIIGNADTKQLRELIDLFTTTARNDLPACRLHLNGHNARMVSLAMHKLKSSARMVGALSFAHLAESLEDAAKAGRLDAATTLFTELEYALNDVEAAVNRLGMSAAPIVIDTPASIAADMQLSRVLIVDDDPVARRQLTLLLSALGIHEVLTVKGAAAALTEIANGSIDLLISDLNMPCMDGIEFLRHLADNNYRGGLIIVSGVEEQLLQTTAKMAQAKGMNLRGIIKKPVTRSALLQLLASPYGTTAASSAQHEKIVITPDDIQEGIRRNEFEIHFQPKVDAATLCVVGMECLARWQHKGQMIPPDVFIDMAERHGLIGSLSELVITKALIGGARLAEAGYDLTIAINLSANCLSDIRLPEFILASVQVTGFKAENLILEITETGVMADIATALDVMTRLRLKGFKLSIDDFGTGYSSMEQLQRIPFGELKLDKSFVQGASEETMARAILASSIEMARKMKLSTVAEGVETQTDLDLVRGLGCDLVQGWYIAKAMPLEQLLVWLKERGTCVVH
jgi:PAS domain S-box-containing protein